MSEQTVLTPEKFKKLLPSLCDAKTSADPAGWTPQNPLWGHCAVVSLVAQNLFGGELLRGSLEHTKFARMRSHYWSRLADGSIEDFTKAQFGNIYPPGLQAETRERRVLLGHTETKRRYQLLSWRLVRALYAGNSLLDDAIYRECFFAALGSQCQKLWFGCVIAHHGEIVSRQCNTPIEPLKHLCEPKCVRFSIQSRTESMLGACSHAEEFSLWEVARAGIPLAECELYIAGVYPNGMPWFKTEAVHTCLRCSTQMYQARINSILVPVIDHWERIGTEEALRGAVLYATKERSV